MHAEALQWVERCVDHLGPFRRVVEIGSRDINGSVRHVFHPEEYVGVDLVEGPGVDVVGDFVELAGTHCRLTEIADCVVSTEALEHYPTPADVIDAAYRTLRPGGVLIATMAGPGRSPHSGLIEGPPQGGEHYRNVEPDELQKWLAGWTDSEIDVRGYDLRCWARR